MNFLRLTLISIFIVASSASSFAFNSNLLSNRVPQFTMVNINPSAAISDKSQTKPVTYLTPEEREQYRVVIEQGTVYSLNGTPYPNTINTKAGHLNHINYVMDSNGNFYLFNEYVTKNIRHSSIFAGGPVAGAGEIVIQSGQVIYIDSDSGHYNTRSLLPNVLLELRADGVNTANLTN